MVTPAMGAAKVGPMYSLRKNGDQHGGHGFHLHLSTFQGSSDAVEPWLQGSPSIRPKWAVIFHSFALFCQSQTLSLTLLNLQACIFAPLWFCGEELMNVILIADVRVDVVNLLGESAQKLNVHAKEFTMHPGDLTLSR